MLKFMFYFSILLFDHQYRVESLNNIPYVSGLCPPTEYLSSIELKCVPCSPNAIRSSNGLSCVCEPGYHYKKNGGGSQVLCEKCQLNEVTSDDGWSCVSCNSTTNNPSKNCPVCKESEIPNNPDIFGNQDAKSCNSCAPKYHKKNNKCLLCTNILNTDSKAVTNNACRCTTHFSTNSTCFDSKIDASPILYYMGNQVSSGYLKMNMEDNAALCQVSIESGCQNIASMCLIAVYNQQNQVDSPCSIFSKMKSKPGMYPVPYYTTPLSITQFPISHQYVKGELLSIILATYDNSGQFLGFRNATQNGNLQLCENSAIKRKETFRFGTHYIESCLIPVAQLFNQSLYLPLFYDPYLSYTDSDGKVQLYPIPIKIGNKPTMFSDESSGIFSRRLLLVDNFGSISHEMYPYKTANYVTFISSMKFVVTKQYSDAFDLANDGKIFVPYLEINLTTFSLEDSRKFAAISFEVIYTNEMKYFEDFNYRLSVAMGVLCALGGLYTILRGFFWCRRSGILGFEGLVIIKTLAYACASISNAFFIVIFSISLYFLILYKNQTLFSIIPPDNDSFFIAYLISAFLLKFLEIIHIFVNQCNIDIFLIDWERPKHIYNPKQIIEPSKFDHTEKTEHMNEVCQKRFHDQNDVSIWRTYFIANEWNEIQTYRKTSLIFNLVFVLLFMEVIGFKNITTFDCFVNYSPSTDAYKAPDYRIFRFAVIVSIFGITGFIQWLYTVLIYERVFEDKLRNYVDLCSVANVSVFVLVHRLFGYYIHGRNVHGSADVSLAEMYVGLQKENSGSCAARGLEINSSQQTYIMALPGNFRNGLDDVYRPGRTNIAESARNFQYLEVTKFLHKFIYRTTNPLIRFLFQDRKFFEDIFDGEFDHNFIEGRFYRDNGTSFGNVLFYGQEFSLITFDILLFCVVDLILQNTVFDAFITWGFVTILKMIRNSFGSHNLARKTLVDRRFLI